MRHVWLLVFGVGVARADDLAASQTRIARDAARAGHCDKAAEIGASLDQRYFEEVFKRDPVIATCFGPPRPTPAPAPAPADPFDRVALPVAPPEGYISFQVGALGGANRYSTVLMEVGYALWAGLGLRVRASAGELTLVSLSGDHPTGSRRELRGGVEGRLCGNGACVFAAFDLGVHRESLTPCDGQECRYFGPEIDAAGVIWGPRVGLDLGIRNTGFRIAAEVDHAAGVGYGGGVTLGIAFHFGHDTDRIKRARAESKELTRAAFDLARKDDCATVARLGERVYALDARIYERGFMTDPPIVKCLQEQQRRAGEIRAAEEQRRREAAAIAKQRRQEQAAREHQACLEERMRMTRELHDIKDIQAWSRYAAKIPVCPEPVEDDD